MHIYIPGFSYDIFIVFGAANRRVLTATARCHGHYESCRDYIDTSYVGPVHRQTPAPQATRTGCCLPAELILR